MTHTNEKAPSACDTEGFDTDTHKADSATGTQHSKAITTLIAELTLAVSLTAVMEPPMFGVMEPQTGS